MTIINRSLYALLLSGCLLTAMFLTGCSTTQENSVNNIDLTKVDFDKNYKTGSSCARWFVGFGPFGNNSVMRGAKQGDIKKVALVEYDFTNWIVYAQTCVRVYGE